MNKILALLLAVAAVASGFIAKTLAVKAYLLIAGDITEGVVIGSKMVQSTARNSLIKCLKIAIPECNNATFEECFTYPHQYFGDATRVKVYHHKCSQFKLEEPSVPAWLMLLFGKDTAFKINKTFTTLLYMLFAFLTSLLTLLLALSSYGVFVGGKER